MGVKFKTNWGRSFPLSRTQGPPVELLRIDLPEPRELTLYLGDASPETVLLWPNQNDITINWGSGGTANDMNVIAGVRGTVVHLVAKQLTARTAAFTPYAVPPDKLPLLRASAMAGLGRPFTSRRRLYNNANSNNLITAGSTLEAFLSPWSTEVQISIEPGSGGGVGTSVTVTEINRNPIGDTAVVVSQPLANYANGKALHPLTNVLLITNNNTSTVYADVVETFIT